MLLRQKTILAFAVITLVVISNAAHAQTESITLQSVDGREVKLADMKGKVVVMSFGGTQVPLSAKELPALQKLADRFSPRGVMIYWVSVNSDKPGARSYASNADLKSFAEKHHLQVKVLRDPDQAAYKALAMDGVPTLMIFDQNGKVVLKQLGFGTDHGEAYSEIIRFLERLIK